MSEPTIFNNLTNLSEFLLMFRGIIDLCNVVKNRSSLLELILSDVVAR